MELRIHPEYQAISVPTDSRSLVFLEGDCLANGIRDPIKHDEHGNILDGMRRFDIATRHRLGYDTDLLLFESESEKRAWIAKKPLEVRKLTPVQMRLAEYAFLQFRAQSRGSKSEAVKEVAEMLSEGQSERRIKTTVGKLERTMRYGDMISTLAAPLRTYLWKGGTIPAWAIKELRGLDEPTQIQALNNRAEMTWRHAISRAKGEEFEVEFDVLIKSLQAAVTAVGKARRLISEFAIAGDPRLKAYGELHDHMTSELKDVQRDLRSALPNEICTECSGEGCDVCRQIGYTLADE